MRRLALWLPVMVLALLTACVQAEPDRTTVVVHHGDPPVVQHNTVIKDQATPPPKTNVDVDVHTDNPPAVVVK